MNSRLFWGNRRAIYPPSLEEMKELAPPMRVVVALVAFTSPLEVLMGTDIIEPAYKWHSRSDEFHSGDISYLAGTAMNMITQHFRHLSNSRNQSSY